MGICNSCESTSVVMAKLILHDGSLQEFSNPVRVSQVLEKNPNCFICSSDDMEFDCIPSATGDEDLLQLGELYFALPLSSLHTPLGYEEMGALVIKASQALKTDATAWFRKMFCGCGIKKVDPLLLPMKRVGTSNSTAIDGGFSDGGYGGASGSGGGLAVKRKRRAAGCRPGSDITAKLTVILEEEVD